MDEKLSVSDLRTEYTRNPLGIDEPNPRFSWVPLSEKRGRMQKAFRIIVSSSIENALNLEADIWDSGKVESDFNIAEYRGPPLRSFSKYFWRVKWWDQDGQESDWSEVAFFETGPLNPDDWANAAWIGGGQLLRKEFEVMDDVVEARVYISGLGYYELRLNGKKVGDKALDPIWSEYDKKVYYSTYDVTHLIRKGLNAIGIILGRGRYAPSHQPTIFKLKYYDEPKAILLLRLIFNDGSVKNIISDKSWKCLEKGPILSDDIYLGYKYDFRLEPKGWDLPGFDDRDWKHCSEMKPPKGRLVSSSTIPSTKIMGLLKPVKVINPLPNVYVFDFGQNITGWVRLKVRNATKGTTVKIRYSELINEDGTLNTLNLRGAQATDVFILDDSGDQCWLEPRFTYHGFRYVEVVGYPGVPSSDDIEAVVIGADLERCGSFTCSNQLINEILKLCIWSLRNNLNNGIQSDCPQRDERMGWLGDLWLSAETAILHFNIIRYYEKIIDDIIDSQRDDGSIPDFVPVYWEWDVYPADPAWGTALIILPWYLYQYYGDKRILEKSYEPMKKWWLLLYSMTKDGILYYGKYGDWVPPGRGKSFEHCPHEILSTWILFRDAKILKEIADILGRVDDAKFFEEKKQEIYEAFNRNFLRESQGWPGLARLGYYSELKTKDGNSILLGGSQTTLALPLAEGMVPREAFDQVFRELLRLVKDEWDRHLNAGIIGAKYVPEVLAENGALNLAYEVLTQETYPSYGYMIKEGATTLWERWEKLTGNAMNSYDHHMFASVGAWICKYLGGLRIIKEGFKEIIIEPPLIDNLLHASLSIETIRGVLQIMWSRGSNAVVLDLSIPVGTVAEVRLPKLNKKASIYEGDCRIWESGKTVNQVNGILSISEQKDKIIIKVGSGRYSFKMESE